MPFRTLRYIAIVFIAQFTASVAGANAQAAVIPQDSVKRVIIKMSAKEIPAVDYEKLFKEASPIEVKPARSVQRRRNYSVKSNAVANKAPAAGKQAPIVSKPQVKIQQPVKVAIKSTPVPAEKASQKKPLLAAKPAAKPAAKKAGPIAIAKQPQSTIAAKRLVSANKPVEKPLAKIEPTKPSKQVAVVPAKRAEAITAASSKQLAATKQVQKSAQPAQKTAAVKSVVQNTSDDQTLTASINNWQGKINESSAPIQSIDVNETSSGMDRRNRAISEEQARWEALADSQLRGESDPVVAGNNADNKMNYLYIGFALTALGVILGMAFGRPAFLVSVVGVVFVVIGLFIRT